MQLKSSQHPEKSWSTLVPMETKKKGKVKMMAECNPFILLQCVTNANRQEIPFKRKFVWIAFTIPFVSYAMLNAHNGMLNCKRSELWSSITKAVPNGVCICARRSPRLVSKWIDMQKLYKMFTMISRLHYSSKSN